MLLRCDVSAFDRYVSQAQRSRVISEAWFASNAYCLSCDNDSLKATDANTKARDFVCVSCSQSYELKTFKLRPKRRLIDGAYQPLMDRILDGSAPALMMLERDEQWQVRSLTAIHHLFLTPEIVERRKPLALTARRAGWVGCNIRLDLIVPEAKVDVISDGVIHERRRVRRIFQRFASLEQVSPRSRGWTTLTLRAIQSLGGTFLLEELYSQEQFFAAHYRGNKNIRAKLRQQLQVLRDLGFLEFLGHGRYKALTNQQAKQLGCCSRRDKARRYSLKRASRVAFIVSCPSCNEQNTVECKFDAWAKYSIIGIDADGDLALANEYDTQIFDYHEFECNSCGGKFGELALVDYLKRVNSISG